MSIAANLMTVLLFGLLWALIGGLGLGLVRFIRERREEDPQGLREGL